MYRAGEVSVHRACCERATQPYSLGGGGYDLTRLKTSRWLPHVDMKLIKDRIGTIKTTLPIFIDYFIFTDKYYSCTVKKLYNLYLIWNCKIYEPRDDKTNNVAVHQAKTKISLGIRPVWSEPSLCAQWVAKDPNFLQRCPGWSESSLGARSLCWFCHAEAQIYLQAVFLIYRIWKNHQGHLASARPDSI